MEKNPPRLVLASGSSYKRALLGRLNLPFESRTADVDESRLTGEAPKAMAKRLAAAKADAAYESGWVIGADQVIALEDRVFSKPGSTDVAVEQLLALQGRVHQLITSVCVKADTTRSAVVTFEMHMRVWSREYLERYVEEDQPLDCAGSYKLEEGGIRLFEKMVGVDYTAIVGLPLTVVWSLLEETGYPLPT